MKLIDIIKYLKSSDTLLQFYKDYNFSLETESILVYMKNSLNIDSELFFFKYEDTDDNLQIEKEGTKYFQLFSLDLGVEFYSYFEDFFEAENYSNLQRANRILEYVINDA